MRPLINIVMKVIYKGYVYEQLEDRHIIRFNRGNFNNMSVVPTLEVDNNSKPTTNSLGLPIAKTPEGISNFWNWFGNSVTVDEKGQPVVFYHGTYTDFDEFQHIWDREDFDADNDYSEGYNGGNLGVGFYFTKNEEYAKRFGRLKKYYLKITNLYDLTDETNISELNERYDEEQEELAYGMMGEVIDDIIKENKYDGVYAMGAGGLSYGTDEWTVLSSSQIKSVENSGEFSNTPNVNKE